MQRKLLLFTCVATAFLVILVGAMSPTVNGDKLIEVGAAFGAFSILAVIGYHTAGVIGKSVKCSAT
jgi:hypothetical protein